MEGLMVIDSFNFAGQGKQPGKRRDGLPWGQVTSHWRLHLYTITKKTVTTLTTFHDVAQGMAKLVLKFISNLICFNMKIRTLLQWHNTI